MLPSQAQLLELRTNNYQLSDELRKNGVELTSLRQKVAYLDKEFSKAQKALSKSKKAQEVEGLLSENEMLQAKLHSQEEDFRLQNSTLMAEFSKVLVPWIIEGGLQAENTALQKNVAALQERYGKEAGRPPAASEGEGDPPGGPASPVVAPMPLAEVELKWEMEKEEKRLLWEQLQGLEVNLGLLGLGCQKAGGSFTSLPVSLGTSRDLPLGPLSLHSHFHHSFQIQTAKTQELNMLREQTAGLTAELQQRQTQYEDLMGQKDDLNCQLQESLRANSRLLEQLQELGQEKEQLIQELQEARKSAEKRKAMLDELAMETLQEKSQHKEELGAVRLRHEKEVLGVRARYERELRELHEDKKRQEEELRGQIREEKARTRELETLQQTVEELQAQVHSMDGAKGWFERRLKEAE
ncbi:PREDICTED: GRIP1-associated protein 1, partial [Bison bison bison]|uniref:GRIP1-associated protein 1 n=1 Tax=Bison bison bison TaxID=43346 RepID=A0A6P3I6K5_BISBB